MLLSILITHYNRSQAVVECIESFQRINFDFEYEFIVSDDGSSQEHLELLRGIDSIKLLESSSNQGLGVNINKGIKKCTGNYILYCQEDFYVKGKLENVFDEMIELLSRDCVQMIRLTANYNFPQLLSLSKNVSRIPKFSFNNFLYNAFQYSDHPFIVKSDFFQKNGFYLEKVKGSYCELEYAIRIMKSAVKIGILNDYLFRTGLHGSVLNKDVQKSVIMKWKKIYKIMRALRLHLEWLAYNFRKRELLTYRKKTHQLQND